MNAKYYEICTEHTLHKTETYKLVYTQLRNFIVVGYQFNY